MTNHGNPAARCTFTGLTACPSVSKWLKPWSPRPVRRSVHVGHFVREQQRLRVLLPDRERLAVDDLAVVADRAAASLPLHRPRGHGLFEALLFHEFYAGLA